MARRRITIPLYGPSALGYAQTESELRLIVDRLGVHVAEPTELVPTRPEQPLRHTTEEETQVPPRTVPPPIAVPPYPSETGEVFDEVADVFYFRGVDLQHLTPTVLESVRFSPIQHKGLIYVIETASFLPSEALDIVQRQAEKRNIPILPIYVRRIT